MPLFGNDGARERQRRPQCRLACRAHLVAAALIASPTQAGAVSAFDTGDWQDQDVPAAAIAPLPQPSRSSTAVSIEWLAFMPDEARSLPSGHLDSWVYTHRQQAVLLTVQPIPPLPQPQLSWFQEPLQSINANTTTSQDEATESRPSASIDGPHAFSINAVYRRMVSDQPRGRVHGGLFTAAELQTLIDNAPLLPGEALKDMPLAALLANAMKGMKGNSGTMILPPLAK